MGSPTCPTCGGRTIFTTRPCGGDEWNEYYRGADCRDPFHPWNNGPDVGDDDPACVCAHLGRSSCDKHAPTSDLPRPIGNTPPAPADDATRHESASAEAMREACARLCEENGVVTTPQGRRLTPDRYAPTGAVHEGMVYAAAIRAIPLPARDDAVEDAASVERAASKWIASEVDAYPGTTMDDRIASWMRGGVHPDDVSRFLVDAYVAGHRAALRREKESRSDDSRPASGQGCA